MIYKMFNNNVAALWLEMEEPEETHVDISILTDQFSETTTFCSFSLLTSISWSSNHKVKKQMVSQAETAHHCLSGSGAVWGARWEDSGNVCVWLRPVFQTWRHWWGEDSHEHHWPRTTDRGVAGSGERWSRGGAAQKPTFLKEIFLNCMTLEFLGWGVWCWNEGFQNHHLIILTPNRTVPAIDNVTSMTRLNFSSDENLLHLAIAHRHFWQRCSSLSVAHEHVCLSSLSFLFVLNKSSLRNLETSASPSDTSPLPENSLCASWKRRT